MTYDEISARARQFKRHETRYEARLDPHADDADQFRTCLPDAQNGLSVTDVSQGGLGFVCGVYVPRNLRVVLHISGAVPQGRELTLKAVVRRCFLLDHKPTYQVGLQFLDPTGEDERALVQHALKKDEGSDRPVAAGKERVTDSV